MKNLFEKNAGATTLLTKWWQGLERNKGTRAELRRCSSAIHVTFHPEFPRICSQLAPYLEGEWSWETRLATVVGLLSHVRYTSDHKLARAMAGNPPEVSELRFRRLLQRDRNDLYGAMVRILRMLDNKANLPDLMSSVFYWDDNVRKRWAFDYFPNTPESKTA